MRELPIVFNTEMVRAIPDGRKTQIRLVIKPQPESMLHDKKRRMPKAFWTGTKWVKPPYQPGDRLWVKETWYKNYPHRYGRFFYRTDGECIEIPTIYGETMPFSKADGLRWRPSTHMPKEAARIWLEVKGVRVERVQDIVGSKDVFREGCPENEKHDALNWFVSLWDKIYAKKGFGWDVNPWVWVIEFKVLEVQS